MVSKKELRTIKASIGSFAGLLFIFIGAYITVKNLATANWNFIILGFILLFVGVMLIGYVISLFE